MPHNSLTNGNLDLTTDLFGEPYPFMPSEITIMILSHLSHHERLFIAPQVSKTWYQVIKYYLLAKEKEQLAEKLRGDLWDMVQRHEINLSAALRINSMSREERKQRLPDITQQHEELCGLLTTDLGTLFIDKKLVSSEELMQLPNNWQEHKQKYKLLFSKAGYQLLTNQRMTFAQIERVSPNIMESILKEYADLFSRLIDKKFIFASDIPYWPDSFILGLENARVIETDRVQRCLKQGNISLREILRLKPSILQIILSDAGIDCLIRRMFSVDDIIKIFRVQDDFDIYKRLQYLLSGEGMYCYTRKLMSLGNMLRITGKDFSVLKDILSKSGRTLLEQNLITIPELIHITRGSWGVTYLNNLIENLQILSTEIGQHSLANGILTPVQAFLHYDKTQLLAIFSSKEKMAEEAAKNEQLRTLMSFLEFKYGLSRKDYAVKLIKEVNMVKVIIQPFEREYGISRKTLNWDEFEKLVAQYKFINTYKTLSDIRIDFHGYDNFNDFIFMLNQQREIGNNLCSITFTKTLPVKDILIYNKLKTALQINYENKYLNTYLETQLPAANQFMEEAAIILDSNNETTHDVIQAFKIFFEFYQKLLKNTGYDYFQACFESLNQRCLAIASAIVDPAEAIVQLIAPNISSYSSKHSSYDIKKLSEINDCFKPQNHFCNGNTLLSILNLMKDNEEWLTLVEKFNLSTIAGEISKQYYETCAQLESVSFYGKLRNLVNVLNKNKDQTENKTVVTEMQQYWLSLTKTQRALADSLFGKHEYSMITLATVLKYIFHHILGSGDRWSIICMYFQDAKRILEEICHDDYCFDILISIIPPDLQALAPKNDFFQIRRQFSAALDNPKFTKISNKKPDIKLANLLFSALIYILPGKDITKAYDSLDKLIQAYANTVTKADILSFITSFRQNMPSQLKLMISGFMKNNAFSICDVKYIIEKQYTLQRLELCKLLLDNIDMSQANLKDFEYLLSLLEPKERMTLISAQITFVRQHVNFIDELQNIAKYLPFDDCIEFILQSKRIVNFSDLKQILEVFEIEKRLEVTKKLFPIKIDETDLCEIKEVLKILKPEDRFKILKNEGRPYFFSLTNDRLIYDAIKKSPCQERIVNQIISCLIPEDKLEFITCLKIANVSVRYDSYVTSCLRQIEETKRITMIERSAGWFLGHIIDDYQYADILNELPLQGQLRLIEIKIGHLADLFTKNSNFDCAKMFSGREDLFFQNIFTLINDCCLIHYRDGYLNSSFQAAFINFLKKHPPIERLTIAKKYPMILSNVYCQDSLYIFPENDWQNYIMLATGVKKWSYLNSLTEKQKQCINEYSEQAVKARGVIEQAKNNRNVTSCKAQQIAEIFHAYAHPPLFSFNWRHGDLQRTASRLAKELRNNPHWEHGECMRHIRQQIDYQAINKFGTLKGVLYLIENLDKQDLNSVRTKNHSYRGRPR